MIKSKLNLSIFVWAAYMDDTYDFWQCVLDEDEDGIEIHKKAIVSGLQSQHEDAMEQLFIARSEMKQVMDKGGLHSLSVYINFMGWMHDTIRKSNNPLFNDWWEDVKINKLIEDS